MRRAAVAGRFYSADAATLRSDIESFLSSRKNPAAAVGCIVPHAGYIYSGHVAGAVFASIEVPERIVILCPNHTGRGTPLAVGSAGSWETPLGEVLIDTALAEDLKARFPLLSEDQEAHRSEHAIEVELPFLQVLRPGFRFVPIAIGTSQLPVLEALGMALADSIRSLGEPVLIIASSDMNHYESNTITREKDRKAIEQILALNGAVLHKTVQQKKISMCGYSPAIVMMTAAKSLGANLSESIDYATSGDVSGDHDKAVGYAGIVIR